MAEKNIPSDLRIAFLSVPIAILLILPSFADPVNLPKLIGTFVMAASSGVIFVLLRVRAREAIKSKQLKLIPSLYLLLAIFMIISGFLGNRNVYFVMLGANGRNNGLIYYLSSLILVLVIIFSKIGNSERDYLFRILRLTTVPFGLYCALQFFEIDPIPWKNIYNPVIGTLGNPNFSSSALAIFATIWFYSFSQNLPTNKARAIQDLLVSTVLASLMILTDSLQGIMVLFFGIVLVLVARLSERSTSLNRPIWILLIVGLGMAIVFVSFLGIGPLGNFLEQYTLKLRLWYSYFAIQSMLAYPLFGIGVDNYVAAFRKFRTEEFIENYGYGVVANNAHSTPLQIGATFGVVVFSIFCIIQLLILSKAVRIILSKEIECKSIKGISIVWVLVFSQSLLSIEIIGLGVLNWVLGAVLVASRSNSGQLDKVRTRKGHSKTYFETPAWTGAATIMFLLVFSSISIPLYREDQNFLKIATANVSTREGKQLVRESFRELTQITLSNPERVSSIIQNMFLSDMSNEIRQTVLNLYKSNPDDARAIDLLATFYQNENETSQEISLREILRTLDPLNPRLEMAIARAYSRAGMVASLSESIARLDKLIKEDDVDYKEFLELKSRLED